MTFRMRGHEEASGTKYVPKDLFETWAIKDPVANYERFLLEAGVLDEGKVAGIRERLKDEIQAAWDAVFAEPEIVPDATEELGDVYATTAHAPAEPATPRQSKKRYIDALSEGLGQAMERDARLVLMGQDVAEYGGVFKVTEGFVQRFGRERVRNTPLCESAILGAGLGLAIAGRPSVVEMQFADFVACGFNQIVNNLAKTHYRWGQAVNVTVRMPTGAGTGAGPFHSQSNEAWFAHVPGLRVLYPATPFDAKGLIAAAVLEPNPVIFFEHKLLYRSIEGLVPDDYYTLPIGVGRVAREGRYLTVVTYGAGVHWALEAAEARGDDDVEVIDLRSLLPWDRDLVFRSVEKTSRCLVLHEDTLTCGIGAEIAATVGERMFEQLDAPVTRLAAMETPVPFHPTLERQFLPRQRVGEAIEAALRY
jgi:2-oxoisovalerate dehydrogenase E1 component